MIWRAEFQFRNNRLSTFLSLKLLIVFKEYAVFVLRRVDKTIHRFLHTIRQFANTRFPSYFLSISQIKVGTRFHVRRMYATTVTYEMYKTIVKNRFWISANSKDSIKAAACTRWRYKTQIYVCVCLCKKYVYIDLVRDKNTVLRANHVCLSTDKRNVPTTCWYSSWPVIRVYRSPNWATISYIYTQPAVITHARPWWNRRGE